MRSIDQYGYVSVNGNHYWVPGIKRFEVKVLQFLDQINAPEWIKKKILSSRSAKTERLSETNFYLENNKWQLLPNIVILGKT